jgi:hypothetical protein
VTMPGRSGGQIRLDVVPDARLLGPRLVAQAKTAAITAERRAGKVQFTPDTRRMGPLLLRGMRDPLRRAGTEGQSAFKWLAAGTVAVGINQAVQAASSLNETVNKSRVVFGPASKLVEDFGRGSATSIGMSTQAAVENAATLGNLFVSMKIGQGQAAQMSTTMVKLAGDMASFNNASPQETLDAIRAGLVGETEPLRRFGVNLNEASLKAEAMRLGLGKIGPTLTAQQRTQAAYSLILQQTTTAQGDFARTSDGLANRQRILAAQYKDAQATLGTALLPAMTTAVGVASSLAKGFADLDASTGGLSTKLLLGAVAAGALTYGIVKAVGVAKDAQAIWLGLRATQAAGAATAGTAAGAQATLGATTAVSSAAATAAAGRWAMLATTLGGVVAVLALAASANTLVTQSQSLGARIHANQVAPIYQKLGIYSKERVRQLQAEASGTGKAGQAAKAAGRESNVYADATAALAQAQAAADPQLAELTSKLKTQREALKSAKQATTEAVLGYKGLITQSKVTTAEVIKDVRNQTSNFRTYSKDVRRLIKAGVSPDAIQELSRKGPEYVHALAVGSNRQLEVYKRYWRDRQREVRGSFAASLDLQYQNLVRQLRAMQRRINALEGKNVSLTASLGLQFSPSFSQKDWVRVRLLAGKMAGGGEVGDDTPGKPGTKQLGPRGRDTQLRWLDPREHVLTAREVAAAGGHAAIIRWRKLLLAGQVPGMQTGGPIGRIRRKIPEVSKIQAGGTRAIMDRGLTKLLAQTGGGGGIGGLSGPGGWRWQMAVLRAAFPGLALISGYRPGAITSTGNRSYHSMGRAVDIPPRMEVFDWIRSRYGRNTRELIFTPAGGRQIHNGRPHIFTGGTIRQDHIGHIHWAYRNGAWRIPSDQVAGLHRGELVVPSDRAEGFRQAMDPDALAAAIVRALSQAPLAVNLDGHRVSDALAGLGRSRSWDAGRVR